MPSRKRRCDCKLFDKLPTLVLRKIAIFLDYPSWYTIQSIYVAWRAHPPSLLTLSDSNCSEHVWNCPDFPLPQCQFTTICTDAFYGGLVESNGACGLLLRTLARRHSFCSRLTSIDLTGQCQRPAQVSSLLSPKTAPWFPCLKFAAFRLAVSRIDGLPSDPIVEAKAPIQLEELQLHLACCFHCKEDAFDGLHPLLKKVKRLSWVVADTAKFIFVDRFPWPLVELVSLEASFLTMRHLLEIQSDKEDNFESIMPNLAWVTIHSPFGISTHAAGRNLVTVTGSLSSLFKEMDSQCAPMRKVVWGSSRPINMKREGLLSVEEVTYSTSNMRISSCDLCVLEKLVRLNTFVLRSCSATVGVETFFELFSLLQNFPLLVRLTLPKELLMAWSNDKSVRDGMVTIASRYSFPSLRRLHFASNDKFSNLNLVTSVPISGSESCDGVLLPIFRIFPNVETLIIGPVPYFRGGSNLLDLTNFSQLKKLFIMHSRSLPYDHHQRRLALSKWLPYCKTLEVFLLYTQNFNWMEERTDGGLLDCLQKNSSLRYVCVVSEASNCSSAMSVTRSDIERLLKGWSCRKGPLGKYILFISHEDRGISCLGAVPNSKARRRFRITERFEVPRWLDLVARFPELFSVFWQDLASEVDFGIPA
ncbi:unnamed protein product [Mesocestoides corti]|uniref:Uncharacterized protein n=1 Tax=Mesocestoides corti TaxID=53468 RepID=A0A0R3U491_MESCO|nr:unnamed protein product [Mesocestoides corti]